MDDARPFSTADLTDIAGRLRAAGCVFAEDEARLLAAAARTRPELQAMAGERASGTPLEHVVGWAEFAGRRIEVGRGVFVPRRRTEFLVRLAVAAAPAGAVLADLCCGSGALGVSVAAALPGAELHAADIDPAAVACARRNVIPAGGRVYQGDLFTALPADLAGRIDVLLANVPYVPAGEIGLLPAEAREHEPRVALDGGADGLDVLRRVAGAAARWLVPGGVLLSEVSDRQAGEAAAIVGRGGLAAAVAAEDELGATVVTGTRPISPPAAGRNRSFMPV